MYEVVKSLINVNGKVEIKGVTFTPIERDGIEGKHTCIALASDNASECVRVVNGIMDMLEYLGYIASAENTSVVMVKGGKRSWSEYEFKL